jgi:hypothetical protein
MTHPSFASLLDYVEGSLPPEARAAIDEHLAGPCSQCSVELSRIRAALGALANDDTVAPPEETLRRAVAAFRARPAAPPRVRIAAILVFDNYRQSSLAAVRGPAARARQLLFTAEGLDIDLQITFAEGGATLVGQILGQGQPSIVRLHRAGEVLDDVGADAFGRFAFRPIPQGKYDLVIEFDSREVAIEGLEIHDAG